MLVQVQAAGLNVVDEKIRAGAFKSCLRYELPQLMGSDVAGTVIGVGAKVWAFALGDQVYAQLRTDRIGTFAERIAGWVIPVSFRRYEVEPTPYGW